MTIVIAEMDATVSKVRPTKSDWQREARTETARANARERATLVKRIGWGKIKRAARVAYLPALPPAPLSFLESAHLHFVCARCPGNLTIVIAATDAAVGNGIPAFQCTGFGFVGDRFQGLGPQGAFSIASSVES